ncbi:MAG TPA: peptidoglycan bridge formation glycyltransferase FemA/FemB family protein [Ktedonobacterales bacterium]
MRSAGQAQAKEASDQSQWNDAVNAAPRADLLQSWEWGEFKRLGGWTPLRLLVSDGEEPVAGAQLLSRRVMGAQSLYAPRGPWWRDDERGRAGLATLLDWIRRQRPAHAPFLRVDPPLSDPEPLTALGFRPAPRQIQPRATIIVDLTPADEAILAAFNSRVRYNARHAQKKGVAVSEGGVENTQEFWRLLNATATRKGFIERDLSYFDQLMRTFGDNARIILARYEGAIVYGAMVVVFGQTAYYLYGGSGGDRSVKPSELGQYRAMLWAKSRGATRYDMWGIPFSPTPENPLYTVYTFKSGFGGQEARYAGALDLPLTPILGARAPALEALALKSLSFARGRGFRIEDHLA